MKLWSEGMLLPRQERRRSAQPLAERCVAHERYTANRERYEKRGVFLWLHLRQRWLELGPGVLFVEDSQRSSPRRRCGSP